jgi:hypothetical protein
MFLAEPSTLSQITALGILIEILDFRRPRYLFVMALGVLVAYSGTGLMLLLIFLPLAGLRHGRAGLSALFVVMFMLGLFATGIMNLSAFIDRIGEFEDTRSSGFARFVAPFWLTAKHFDTASLGALLVGSGPGTVKTFADLWYVTAEVNWFKLFYEYGIIGSLTFCCFLASCFRRSRCPGLVIAVIIFNYLFEQGAIAIAMALCTLNGPEPRRALASMKPANIDHPSLPTRQLVDYARCGLIVKERPDEAFCDHRELQLPRFRWCRDLQRVGRRLAG